MIIRRFAIIMIFLIGLSFSFLGCRSHDPCPAYTYMSTEEEMTEEKSDT